MAASGRLGDPADPVGRFVLDWCYSTVAPSTGWVERDGIGVAFRRTPNGKDALGRDGAFFVHAYVWSAGSLDPEVLAGLWDATGWVTEPPEDPPRKLAVVRSGEELGLNAAPCPDDAALHAAASWHLANLGEALGSRIGLAPDEAYGLAAALAALLPRTLGLPAFSTFETGGRPNEYALVASTADLDGFRDITRAGDLPTDWAAAATFLTAASQGDRSCANVVDDVAAAVGSHREFAILLRTWALLDSPAADAAPLDGAALQLLAARPRLLARLMEGPRVGLLAAQLADGMHVAGVVDAAKEAGVWDDLSGALRTEIRSRGAAAAIDALLRVEPSIGALEAGKIAASRAASWAVDPTLEQVDGPSRAAVLRWLARANEEPQPLVNQLLTHAPTASTIARSKGLPVQWRGLAAAQVPGAFSSEELIDFAQFHPDFTAALVTAAPAALEQTRPAFARMTDRTAADLLGVLVRAIPSGWAPAARHSDFMFAQLGRLRADWREPIIAAYLDCDAAELGRWSEAMVNIVVERVLRQRVDRRRLTRPVPSSFGEPGGPVGFRWQQFSRLLARALHLDSRTDDAVDAAVLNITAMTEHERDAALELLVDAMADAYSRADRNGWAYAHERVRLAVGEPAAPFGERIVRATFRAGDTNRWFGYLRVADWIALHLGDALTRDDLKSATYRQFEDAASAPHAGWLHEASADKDRYGRPGRKWLSELGRQAKRRK